ncbi:MAG: mannonate dehydratase [Chitinophagaceae bacterium]
MKELLQTWRWFGPNDPVSLQDIRQAGASGVVTALHHVPYGDVWTKADIQERQRIIREAGLNWDVVESVTIHENIKTRTGNFIQYVENYKECLRNLAACDIKVVTYNFMPVNDWTRTTLDYIMPDGSRALYFNWYDLAVFDIYLLKRQGAKDAYPAAVVHEAETRFNKYTQEEKDKLAGVVMFGIPGEQQQTVELMQQKLSLYHEIDHNTLRENLAAFLREIVPVAEEVGIRLAIHPDDPPFSILGLPRVVSNADDLDYILAAVDSPANGLCFCTGSLGANPKNDLPAMIKKAGNRINFIHLRNTRRDEVGNFFEDDHLGGDTDMYAVMKELLRIQQEVPYQIPFRPDHGHQMMDDLNKVTNPGYSAIGRMRGLSELRGLQLGILKSMAEQ